MRIPNAPLIKLQRAVTIRGFSSSVKPVLETHKAEVTLDFHPGILKAAFYICDTKIPILGNDLLRNKELKLYLCTGKELLSIRQYIINTKSTTAASRNEYIRRCGMTAIAYSRELGHPLQTSSWMRALEEIILPPQSIKTVKAFVDAPLEPSDHHSFLSRFE